MRITAEKIAGIAGMPDAAPKAASIRPTGGLDADQVQLGAAANCLQAALAERSLGTLAAAIQSNAYQPAASEVAEVLLSKGFGE